MINATAPSNSNKRKRHVVILSSSLLCLTLLAGCLSPPQAEVFDAMNRDRNAHGLKSLPTQKDVQAKAQAWAERLARENRLYHSTLSDGVNTRWCSLGENVGYGPSAQSVQKAYMNSPGHKANIVSNVWNGVGVGHAKRGNTVFTVQVFIKTC
jgi:uncharacterized protein YkwD